MTSYTLGIPWPPMSVGQDIPKKPASNSDWCQAACPAQYSSDVDDAPRWGVLSCSQARSRARNSASAGESPKSTVSPRSQFVVEHAGEVGVDAAEHVGGQEGPA